MKNMLGIDSILSEENGQWWENIGCIINCKSLTLFLTSFLRCLKDVANLPR